MRPGSIIGGAMLLASLLPWSHPAAQPVTTLTESQTYLVIYRADSLRLYVDQWRQDSLTIAGAQLTIAGYHRKAELDSTALARTDVLLNASQERQEALQRAIRVRNGIIGGSAVIVALLSIILVLR